MSIRMHHNNNSYDDVFSCIGPLMQAFSRAGGDGVPELAAEGTPVFELTAPPVGARAMVFVENYTVVELRALGT